jgi:hypothetical protein
MVLVVQTLVNAVEEAISVSAHFQHKEFAKVLSLERVKFIFQKILRKN